MGGEERRIERKGKKGGRMDVWMEWGGRRRRGRGERGRESVDGVEQEEWKERGRESREESGRGNGREDECVDKVEEERVGRSDKISDIRIPT